MKRYDWKYIAQIIGIGILALIAFPARVYRRYRLYQDVLEWMAKR